jgi:hypothetical protein
MTPFFDHIRLDQPAIYIIKIQGRLDARLPDWFAGEVQCAIETGLQGDPVTSLTGTVPDQAALHGLLNHLRDLGLVLLYVDCLTAHEKH